MSDRLLIRPETDDELADGSFHKQGMNLQRFMREAAQLSTHLDMHHRIVSTTFYARIQIRKLIIRK